MAASDPERRAGKISKIQESLDGKPPVTHIHNGFAFETHLVTRKNLRELRLRAHRFEGYVGYDVLDASDQIRHNVQPSRPGRQIEVEFIRTLGPNAKDIGVVTQAIVDISVGGHAERWLDIGVKAIEPGFRGRDLGTLSLEDALLEHKGINRVTGQSRMGPVFRYLEKVRDRGLLGKIRGYEEPLTPEDLEGLKLVLSKTKYNRVAVLRTGLCLGIYPKADSRLFIAPPNNPEAVRVVEDLRKRGVEPGGENGVRYVSPVNEEAVETEKEQYSRTETVESAIARSRYEEMVRRIADFFKRPQQFRNLISFSR